MLKLIIRAVSNVLYALGQMAYDFDVLLSAIFFGAEGESISSRLWVASQAQPATASRWARLSYYAWKPARIALDAVVLLVFGEASHTQTAYSRYLAIKAALAKPAAAAA